MTFPSTNFYPLVLDKGVTAEMKLLHIFSFTLFKSLNFFFFITKYVRIDKEKKTTSSEQALKEIL